MAKGQKHYKASGTQHKGPTHRMPDGTLHTGAKHTSDSKPLSHKSASKKTTMMSKKYG